MEVREAVKGIGHKSIRNVIGGVSVVNARIPERIVPTICSSGGGGVLREVQSVRPGVVRVELNAVQRVVLNLRHKSVVVRIDIAGHLSDALIIGRGRAETGSVPVAGVGGNGV